MDDLANLRRALEDVERLKAELVALRERVAKLEAAATPVAPKRRTAEAAPVPPRADPVIHVRRDPPVTMSPAPYSPPTAAADPAWTARLLARYGEAVLDLSGAGEAFISTFQPVAVTQAAGSTDFTPGGDPYDAMLWAVRGENGVHALLPGYKAINNWSGHFAPNRTTTAAQYFGAAFDLDAASPRLMVAAPALLTESSPGRLTLLQKGRLSGFRT